MKRKVKLNNREKWIKFFFPLLVKDLFARNREEIERVEPRSPRGLGLLEATS